MVEGSETRLGQVFLNLIVNAAQAIPAGRAGGNEIRVVTEAESADRVVVAISDTGVGIPADKLERVFDPFFTTKPAGIGTGLGLAICHRLIGELGGSISVKSAVGEGTEFRVVLRRAKEAPAAAVLPPVTGTIVAERGRILVVDDEPVLCKTIRRILTNGHEVVAVASAMKALDMVVAGERFDAILSDLMMPEMTGMELHAMLMRRVPDQARRMIFMTGGAFSADAEAFLQQGSCPSIGKPFHPEALRAVLQQVLQHDAAQP